MHIYFLAGSEYEGEYVFFPLRFFLGQSLVLKLIVWGWSQTLHLLSVVFTAISPCLAEVPSKHYSLKLTYRPGSACAQSVRTLVWEPAETL